MYMQVDEYGINLPHQVNIEMIDNVEKVTIDADVEGFDKSAYKVDQGNPYIINSPKGRFYKFYVPYLGRGSLALDLYTQRATLSKQVTDHDDKIFLKWNGEYYTNLSYGTNGYKYHLVTIRTESGNEHYKGQLSMQDLETYRERGTRKVRSCTADEMKNCFFTDGRNFQRMHKGGWKSLLTRIDIPQVGLYQKTFITKQLQIVAKLEKEIAKSPNVEVIQKEELPTGFNQNPYNEYHTQAPIGVESQPDISTD